MKYPIDDCFYMRLSHKRLSYGVQRISLQEISASPKRLVCVIYARDLRRDVGARDVLDLYSAPFVCTRPEVFFYFIFFAAVLANPDTYLPSIWCCH